MWDFFDDAIEVEGIGSEVISCALGVAVASAILSILWLIWVSANRKPLDYQLFLVEMHTLSHRRVVEVLHVGHHYRPRDSYSRLLERMRARARRRNPDDGEWLAVSDTNVVIQSPSTITGNSITDIPRDPQNRLTLWEIEIPPNESGQQPDARRDSQVAAAAAVSVLGRNVRLTERGGANLVRPSDVSFGSEQPQTFELDPASHQHLNVSLLENRNRRGVVHLPAFRFPTAVMLSAAETSEGALFIGNGNANRPATGHSTPPRTNQRYAYLHVARTENVTAEATVDNSSRSVTMAAAAADVEVPSNDSNAPPNPPPTPLTMDSAEEVAQEDHTSPTSLDDADKQEEPNGPIIGTEERNLISPNSVVIRLKFLDDTLRETRVELSTSVVQFRNTNFVDAVREGKVVRLIFQGQLLRDDSRSLESYGLHDNCVVHCHISNTPYSQPRPATPIPGARPVRRRDNSIQALARRHAAEHIAARLPPADGAVDDRSNLWFARVIFSLLSSQLLEVPVHLASWVVRLFYASGAYLTPGQGNGYLSTTYRRFHSRYLHRLLTPRAEPEDPVAAAAEAAEALPPQPLCIGDYLMWIFGVQCVLVWTFVFNFPQLCDRTAFGLLVLLTLYFLFVVVRNSETRFPFLGFLRRPTAEPAAATN